MLSIICTMLLVAPSFAAAPVSGDAASDIAALEEHAGRRFPAGIGGAGAR